MWEDKTDQTVRSLSLRSKLANPPLVFETPDKLRTLSLCEQDVRKKAVDNFIAAEMRRQHIKLMEEQEMYISKMLEQNPVEISSSTKPAHAEPVPTDSTAAVLREQRAASCRKSRINNKLRKATIKHRSDFLAAKVAATKKALTDLSTKLQNAEQHLLSKDYNDIQLETLRSIYGVSRSFCS